MLYLYVDIGNLRKRIWYPTLDVAKLKKRTMYQTRHTFATLMLSAGENNGGGDGEDDNGDGVGQ